MDHDHQNEHPHEHHGHNSDRIKSGHHKDRHHHIKHEPSHHLYENLDIYRHELDQENQQRNHAQSKYTDLKKQMDFFEQCCDEARKHPESKYDTFVIKQNCINESFQNQIHDAKEKLANLTQALKNIQVCGKDLCCSADCNLNMQDLYIDYNCITKSELSKEIKRFERMQIDLKSNLDRLQWRMDCESKVYYNLLDQFQKLQIELYYLQNLGERICHKGLYLP